MCRPYGGAGNQASLMRDLVGALLRVTLRKRRAHSTGALVAQ
jgi:hypothetical protein